jgi:hypothetical protein
VPTSGTPSPRLRVPSEGLSISPSPSPPRFRCWAPVGYVSPHPNPPPAALTKRSQQVDLLHSGGDHAQLSLCATLLLGAVSLHVSARPSRCCSLHSRPCPSPSPGPPTHPPPPPHPHTHPHTSLCFPCTRLPGHLACPPMLRCAAHRTNWNLAVRAIELHACTPRASVSSGLLRQPALHIERSVVFRFLYPQNCGSCRLGHPSAPPPAHTRLYILSAFLLQCHRSKLYAESDGSPSLPSPS